MNHTEETDVTMEGPVEAVRIAIICRSPPDLEAFAALGQQHAETYFRARDIHGLPSSIGEARGFCAARNVYGAFDTSGQCLGVVGVSRISEWDWPGLTLAGAKPQRLVPWCAVAPVAQGQGLASVLLASMLVAELGRAKEVGQAVVGVHAWCARDNLAGQAVARSVGLQVDEGRQHVARLTRDSPARAYIRLAAEVQELVLDRSRLPHLLQEAASAARTDRELPCSRGEHRHPCRGRLRG